MSATLRSSARNHWRKVPPATYSMAMNTAPCPSTRPTSKTCTTLGCESLAMAWASRWSRTWWSSLARRSTSLRATTRSSSGS
ncbi:hypothetical protein PPSIR1_08272 [Plesiocystis pacifica SIR-1]|uniref:Uncharacterized protein n=1 Tax=Plesiocystis pacifica SIR-1 TaxID=391625 RepID=A6GE29_9BACT|nr:hypothetical protein PPSIR1_08272 [Plesiocystis pacifica SIR-1]